MRFDFTRPMLSIALMCALGCLPASLTPPTLPYRSGEGLEHPAQGLSAEQSVELWVSYQIVIESVDGEPAGYRAQEPCVYYRVLMPAGEHALAVLLDYRSPTHQVTTINAVDMSVQLAAGESYRLLDLASGQVGQRHFSPHLLEGAPSDQTLKLSAGQE